MKATGIVRRIDDVGRIVIPKAVRRDLKINDEDALELFIEGDAVCFRKYYPDCDFCGEKQGDTIIGNKAICPGCLKQLRKAFDGAKGVKN